MLWHFRDLTQKVDHPIDSLWSYVDCPFWGWVLHNSDAPEGRDRKWSSKIIMHGGSKSHVIWCPQFWCSQTWLPYKITCDWLFTPQDQITDFLTYWFWMDLPSVLLFQSSFPPHGSLRRIVSVSLRSNWLWRLLPNKLVLLWFRDEVSPTVLMCQTMFRGKVIRLWKLWHNQWVNLFI